MLRRAASFMLAAALAVPLMATATAGEPSAFDHTFQSIDGQPMPLHAWRGKVLLVVNTASECGFTGQYAGLQDLWERHRDAGLVLIGVPSNDFGGQEPGSSSEIKEFCEVQFGLDFPMTEKAKVKGPHAHPFYRWARDRLGARNVPRWNFHKYVIGRNGQPIAAYSAVTRPNSDKLGRILEEALASPMPSG